MPAAVVPETVACIRTTRAIIGSATLRAPYTLIIAAKPGALQAAHRVLAERRMFPDAGAYRGFRQLEYHRRRAADEQRNGIFQYAPRQRTRRQQRFLPANGHAKLLWRPGAPLKSASTAPLRYRCNGSGRRMAESTDQSIGLITTGSRRYASERPMLSNTSLYPPCWMLSDAMASRRRGLRSAANSSAWRYAGMVAATALPDTTAGCR